MKILATILRLSIILFFLKVFDSCKRDPYPVDLRDDKILINDFDYLNPKGERRNDAVIILPKFGISMSVGDTSSFYSGTTFESKLYWKTESGKTLFPGESVFTQWELKEYNSQTIVQTDTTGRLTLKLTQPNKYKLTQYLYASRADRHGSMNAIDSVSKIVYVSNEREIESLTIDSLTSSSPYLQWGIDIGRPIEVFVLIYKSKDDLEQLKPPIFKSDTVGGINYGESNVQISFKSSSRIPSFLNFPSDTDKTVLQVYIQQDGKSYKYLDNVWGNIFQYLTSGRLSSDRSKVEEDLRLEFGNTKFSIKTVIKFLE